MAKFRAVYGYFADQPGDLSFEVGDIVWVLNAPDTGWWLGRTKDGKQGVFPFNRVEPADEDDEVTDTLAPSKASKLTENAILIRKVEVQLVKPVPAHSAFFNVIAHLQNGIKVEFEKRMEEFRILNQALNVLHKSEEKIVGLDPSERVNCSIPRWADKVKLPEHFAEPMMTSRASILQDWLCKKAGNNKAGDVLILTWLSYDKIEDIGLKKDSISCLEKGEQVINNKERKVVQLAIAKFTWQKKDEQDLHLKRGEILAVWEESAFEGWWIGEKINGNKGLLPHNYVEKLSSNDQKKVLNPKQDEFSTRFVRNPNSSKLKRDTDTDGYQIRTSLEDMIKPSSLHQKEPRLRNKVVGYRFKTTEAFDELMTVGLTIEIDGVLLKNSEKKRSGTPNEGDGVTIYYSGYIWEPQEQTLLEFSSSDRLIESATKGAAGPLIFIVGDEKAIDGIEEAAKRMRIGETIRLTLSPDKAYGKVGLPPTIPPNTFLVYDLTLEQITPKDSISQKLNNVGAQRSTVATRETSIEETELMKKIRANQAVSQSKVSPTKYLRQLTYTQLLKVVQNSNYVEFGIDPTKVEEYLKDDEFSLVFKMERSNWKLLAPFRRQEIKRKVGFM